MRLLQEIGRHSRGVSRQRAVLLVILFALLAIALTVGNRNADPTPTFSHRLDLFFEQQAVDLVDGFGDFTELRFWHDYAHANPNRDEIALPVPRQATLRWHVEAPGGSFRTGVTRLHPTSTADASPCHLRVAAYRDRDASPVAAARMEVPAVPPGNTEPRAVWREGPQRTLALELLDGTRTVEIATECDGIVRGGYLALLSPHVVREPAPSSARHAVRGGVREQWLIPVLDIEPAKPVRFAQRSEDGAAAAYELLPVEVVGTFTGRPGRHAIAFTGDSHVRARVDIAAESVLRGAVALDDRLPPDTAGRLRLRIDGKPVAAWDVDNVHWTSIDVPLGRFAGRDRRLELSSSTKHLTPDAVVKDEQDLASGTTTAVSYLARTVRLAFAEPRIESPIEVGPRVATRERPSVVLIQVDTLRADELEIHGGTTVDLTPHLTRLARRSTVFETAIAPSPWTIPTTVSLLTGRYPSGHGVVDHDRAVIPYSIPTLAEKARDAGLATGAVTANALLQPHAGYARGFTSYAFVPYANARQVNVLARTFMRNHAGRQFFLFLHYFDPHHPYNPPPAWRDRYVTTELRGFDIEGTQQRIVTEMKQGRELSGEDPGVRFSRQRYRGAIAWFDDQLGKLLSFIDEAGLADTTVVIFTADHGEEFFEHGLFGHGSNLYDETIHVPLLITDAGALRGWSDPRVTDAPRDSRRVPGVLTTAAVFAEALERMQVPYDRDAVVPPPSSGEERLVAFSETEKGLSLGRAGPRLRRPQRAARSEEQLLIWRWALDDDGIPEEWVLYDLHDDPRAQHPLPAPGAEAERLRDQLLRTLWRSQPGRHRPGPGPDSGILEHLRALGYVDPAGL